MANMLHSSPDPYHSTAVHQGAPPESGAGSVPDCNTSMVGEILEPAGAAVIAERTWIWGVPLAAVTYEQTLDWVDALICRGKPAYFITANLHYAALTEQDPRLHEVNRKAAFLLADGMPMVWYSRLAGRPLPERVTGADLISLLCARAAERGYRVFLLGGGEGVADCAADMLRHKYSGLQIVGTAAPELDRLSPQEHQKLVACIRAARPQLLLVAFGQPKGELWLAENSEALGVPACVQLGASFDFVIGRIQRAPSWMQRVGLEWLYRIWCEPRRLFPRYFADARFLLRAVCRDVFAGRLQ